MSKPCCTYAPVVYRDKRWECSECGSISQTDDSQLEFDFDYLPGLPYNSGTNISDKKCSCGSEKTYGVDATHTSWCDKNKQ